MEFVDLVAQYRHYRQEIDAAVQAVMASCRFINGPEVAELEERLGAFVGVPQAVACASGTDALQLALMALDIGPGDEVITTPFTFIATAETIALAGATPVFVDIEAESYNIDPERVAAAVNPRTKAIIAVDIFGLPAAYDRLETLADKHGIALIEDAAQSMGGALGERRCGSFGTLATTSFFPAKPLGGYGDGGMVFAHEEEIARCLRQLRDHGQAARYHHAVIGVNSRLDTLQAAVLLAKMSHFAAEIERRREIAARYSAAFADAFTVPAERAPQRSVYAQYCLRHPRRDAVIEHLREAGIPTAVYYPVPLHLQPAFADLGYRHGQLPVTEAVCGDIFALPVHPFLTAAEVDGVIAAVLAAAG
ncbi:MAG: DegT/DnrJ/EryC1/StrS family aminotransferase [Deltaproteobacteria bacterium]|nr:DegT/DnrJ/EryC1/StrS family aminotransferase [Candidatus Anaeroferrophillacea bacterium]